MDAPPLNSSAIIGGGKPRVRSLFHVGSPESEGKSELESTINLRRSLYDTRSTALNQLENFYLPFMKEVYGRASEKLAGNIKPPDELLQLLRQGEQRIPDLSRREIEMRDLRISELLSKVQQLYDQLKQLKPEAEIKIEMPRQLEDYEKKIKRLENLLKIRNEELFFSLKVKAINLLEEFDTERKDIEGLQQLTNENEVFEHLSNKLKARLKDLKSRQRSDNDVYHKEQVEVSQYEENLRYINQTNQLLRNNERRAREKAEEIKKDWKNACERLVQCEKVNEQKDSEIFRLKKLLEERDSQLLKIPTLEKGHIVSVEQLRKDYEAQLKELRMLLNNYYLEINELKATIEAKNEEIEEHMIRQNFLQEEFERANREHVRWKERYESFEKQSDIKRVALEAQYNELLQRIAKMNIQPEQVAELQQFNKELQQSLAAAHNEKAELEQRLQIIEPEIKHMEEGLTRMDSHNKELQSALALMHKEKMESVERIKLLEQEQRQLDSKFKEAQQSLANMHKEKAEKLKAIEQSLSQSEQHNKELQSALALKYKEKSEQAEKIQQLEQQLQSKKSQLESSAAGLEGKYKSQLAHEQTLREALIMQAVSVKEVEHMEKIRNLTDMHNRRISSMEQAFDKKMKTWQNSHDDKFLEELARITEENAILKERLAEKEKGGLYGSNVSTPTVASSLSTSQPASQTSPPPRKIEVIRTKDLRK